jgi:molybdenum cofactor biosynthesis protein B
MTPGQSNMNSAAVITVSDTRSEETDDSGKYLAGQLTDHGYTIAEKAIVRDDVYQLRAVLSRGIAAPDTGIIITTGGTGLTASDITPEAVRPLLDKEIEGFAELFRWLSYEEIGTSMVQSRVLAGTANATLIFCIPGSTHACRTAWEKILRHQLDPRHKPCNFIELLPRLARR